MDSMKRNWSEVNTSASPSTARREYGSGVLDTTGIMKLNTNSSGDWDFVLRATKLDSATGVAKYYVDGKLIAVKAVPHGTPGGSAFRQTSVKGGKIRVITLYLHGVFAEHPELRPAGKCKVAVTREIGDDGVSYLLINLQAQLAVRTVPRDSGDKAGSAKQKAAAGEQKQGRKAQPVEPDDSAETETEDDTNA